MSSHASRRRVRALSVDVSITAMLASLAAAIPLTFAFAAPAHAWTATLDGPRLILADGGGVADAITLLDDGGSLRVAAESAIGLEGPAPAGCNAEGDDLLCPFSSVTTVEVHGGDGDDELVNASSVTTFVAFGEAGADRLVGGGGVDRLDGGDGNDEVTGGGGDDEIAGGVGEDALAGGSGRDRLDGGDGADLLTGGGEDDMLDGGGGDDRVDGGGGADVLAGGAGADALDGGGGDDALDGGEGADTLLAAEGSDRLAGGSGDDVLRASGGAGTVLDGGDGADRLDGGSGPDMLAGGPGDDRLDGGDGDDALDGEAGADTLRADAGADVLAGGEGADTADYGGRVEAVRVTVGAGADDGAADEGDDVRGDVERVLGGSGGDTLRGGAGGVVLDGGAGDDTLAPGPGRDVVAGRAGEDTVTYASRTAGVVVRFGRGAVSGAPGEGDTIADDVENATGGSGPDDLRGLPAVANELRGGAGDDRIDVRSPEEDSDRVHCGGGFDTFVADGTDAVAGDCESGTVDDAPVGASGGPDPFLAGDGLKVVRIDRRGRLRLTVACGPRTFRICTGTVTLHAGAGARRRRLGAGRVRIAAGTTAVVRIKLAPKALRAVRRRHRGGVQVTATLRTKDARRRSTERTVELFALFPSRRTGRPAARHGGRR